MIYCLRNVSADIVRAISDFIIPSQYRSRYSGLFSLKYYEYELFYWSIGDIALITSSGGYILSRVKNNSAEAGVYEPERGKSHAPLVKKPSILDISDSWSLLYVV